MYNIGTNGSIFNNQDHAVSEVIGTIFLLGIVSIALVAIVLVGYSVISNSQSASKINAMEQAFTVADTKISKARFSTSIYQDVPLELRDGTIYVNGSKNDSYILIFDFNDTSKEEKPIYFATLGTIRSVCDQGEIGYQAGGVWRLGNNGSVMISPPDFDYNGVTLTLPIMTINGSNSLAVSGNRDVVISVNSSNPLMIYPNDTFSNPLPEDHFINISIKSRYYKAWADYINIRTRAEAIIDPKNQTTNVTLRAGPPKQTGPAVSGFSTVGLDTSYNLPIETFTMHLVPPNKGNDYRGSFYTKAPMGQELRIYVDRTTGNDNKIHSTISIVYYDPINHVTEKWYDRFTNERKYENPIELDMLDHTIELTYVKSCEDNEIKGAYPQDSSIISSSWGSNISWPWNPWDSTIRDTDPSKNDEDAFYDDPSYSEVTYDEHKTLYDLTQHYLWLMSYLAEQQGESLEFITNQDKKPQWKYDSSSWLSISYKSAVDIKYLYITHGMLNTSLGIRG